MVFQAALGDPDTDPETEEPGPTTDALPTLGPTATPAPTATFIPAPNFAEIRAAFETMTDAQFNAYGESIEDTYVKDLAGKLTDVDEGEILGGFTAWFDVDDGFGSEVAIDVTEEVGLSLERDGRYYISGWIEYASNSFGLTVKLRDAQFTPIGN